MAREKFATATSDLVVFPRPTDALLAEEGDHVALRQVCLKVPPRRCDIDSECFSERSRGARTLR